MSPIIYGILRQKWVGLFVVILVLVINFSEVLVSYIPVKTGDILGWSFYYLTGGYIGIHWTRNCNAKEEVFTCSDFGDWYVFQLCIIFCLRGEWMDLYI